MFSLICLLFCLPFYILYLFVKVFIYLIAFILSLISNIHRKPNKSEDNEEYYAERNTLNTSNDYNFLNINKYDGHIKGYYDNSYCNNVENSKQPVINRRRNDFVQLTDTELKITIEKIQELYKELGFNVKVVDIIKKKYITEYEIIFSKETSQYEILKISNKIIDKFQVDGVKIIRDTKKYNRIYIQIPLIYGKHLLV